MAQVRARAAAVVVAEVAKADDCRQSVAARRETATRGGCMLPWPRLVVGGKEMTWVVTSLTTVRHCSKQMCE